VTPPVVELAGVVKDYRGLRPLRVAGLSLAAAERVAVFGIDQPAAEVLVNVITGAVLPDEGEVRLLGRSTTAIADADEWLATVDRIGIVSERAVLLDALTVLQNLAIPFSLDVEPLPPALRARAAALAGETGVAPADWDRRVGELPGATRLRVRLGRALALDPVLLLFEHPTVGVARADVSAVARDVGALAARRRVAALVLTADADFASAAVPRVLQIDPASGRLSERRARGWFGWR
jgi:ABC-type uncharacterized transport system ATPase subunit